MVSVAFVRVPVPLGRRPVLVLVLVFPRARARVPSLVTPMRLDPMSMDVPLIVMLALQM